MYKNPFDDLFQDTLKVVSPSPLGMLPDFTSVTNSMLKQSELTCKGITKLAEQSIGANLLEAAKSAEAAIGCAFRSLERQSRDVSQILEGMAGSYKIDAAQIIFEAQRTVFHNNIEIVRGFAESLCFEPLVLPTPAVLPIHHHREVPQDSQARTFIQDLIQQRDQAVADGHQAVIKCQPHSSKAFVVTAFTVNGILITAFGYRSHERETRAYTKIDLFVKTLSEQDEPDNETKDLIN